MRVNWINWALCISSLIVTEPALRICAAPASNSKQDIFKSNSGNFLFTTNQETVRDGINVLFRQAVKTDGSSSTFNRRKGRSAERNMFSAIALMAGVDCDADCEYARNTTKRLRKGELFVPEDYNKLVVPTSNNTHSHSAIPVELFLVIRSISEIDEVKEEISLEMDILVQWLDERLQKLLNDSKEVFQMEKTIGRAESREQELNEQAITLNPEVLKQIWSPDIYIENLIKVEQPSIITKPTNLKMSKNGDIGYISRVNIKLKCQFDFQYYPADRQKCPIMLRSYSYSASDLKLVWSAPGVYLQDASDNNFDIIVGKLRRFSLTRRFDSKMISNTTYDALEFTLFARRKLAYQILQTYIPSMLYVGITWLCFMIPKEMIEVRLAISMTTLLTLTAMFASVRENTPAVSYVKAIDVWMASSILFVFMTLLEFAVLLWTATALKNGINMEKPDYTNKASISSEDSQTNKEVVGTPEDIKTTFAQKLRKSLLSNATIIIGFVEDYSFVILSFLFAISNMLYWTWLIYYSGYYDWNVDRTLNAGPRENSSSDNEYKLESKGADKDLYF